MSSPSRSGEPEGSIPHDPYGALRLGGFRLFLIGAFCSNVGRQMATVAVTWQVYQWTNSATALGLVGLMNVIPLLALSLPAGVLADRWDRRWIIGLTTAGLALLSLILAGLAAFPEWVPNWPALHAANDALKTVALTVERQADPSELTFDQPVLPLIFLILLAMAVLRIVGWPARSALIPLLVPAARFSNAVTWNSSSIAIATMVGPALGGFLVAWFGFPWVYLLDAVSGLVLVGVLFGVKYLNPPMSRSSTDGFEGIWGGARFIWQKKIILAASGLDLFAVLLGGAVALLPIYADEILQVGPIGLGWLRAAPSIGAFAMASWIAYRRPLQQPGLAMLWAVAGFGLAIIVFGLSEVFWLSFIALFATGVFDNLSVVVRHSLVQLLTPDALRGRVTAVNQIFIGSSNEIGTLRAGVMAALLGPVAAVVWGGVGTVAVVFLIWRAVPQLRQMPALDRLKPD